MAANSTDQPVLAASEKDIDLTLWRSWVKATIAGGMVGAALSLFFYVATTILALYLSAQSEFPFLAVILSTSELATGTLLGITVGVFQGRALRNSFGARVWLPWATATTLGFALTIAVLKLISVFLNDIDANFRKFGDEVGQISSVIIFSLFMGVIVGSLQCIILRPHARRVAWWPVGIVVGLAVGSCIALGLTSLAVPAILGPNATFFSAPIAFFLYIGFSTCLPWPVTAAITGWVLVKVLKKPGRSDTGISSN